jgi:general secretion pathway protein G
MRMPSRTEMPLPAAGRGFTLLEMLVVLVIIGLVASLVGPQLLGRVDSSRVTTADVQIRQIKGALDVLRLHIGRYPSTDEGLAILTESPSDARARRNWQGPYLEGDVPLDPWGSPYQYKAKSPTSIALYSWGADGKEGGEGINADVGLLDTTAP